MNFNAIRLHANKNVIPKVVNVQNCEFKTPIPPPLPISSSLRRLRSVSTLPENNNNKNADLDHHH